MRIKKITAVLLIALLLISLMPINISAYDPDPKPITVKVNVYQKDGGDTDFIKTYTLKISDEQSDALKPLININLTDALYSYGVLADLRDTPVNASDVVFNGQIRYENNGYNKYKVTIVLKKGTLSSTVVFVAGANGSFKDGEHTVFNNISYGTKWRDAVDVPETIANKGYTFDKWQPGLPSHNDRIYQSATYTALFKTKNYDIDYVLNNGNNDPSNPSKYTIEDNIILSDPTRYGYVFDGWYDNRYFNGSPVTQIPVGSTGDKTFYAKWENRFSVQFQAGENGSLTGNTIYSNIKYGTKWKYAIDSIPIAVADEGYAFDGWSPALPSGNTEIKNDAIYTANFKKINYSITYVLNGGVNHADNPAEYDVKAAVTLKEPEKIGYFFLGWYETENFSGTAVALIPKGSTGNKTFYAKWQKDESMWNSITFVTDGRGILDGTAIFSDILDGTTWSDVIVIPIPNANAGYAFDKWIPALPTSGSKINDNVTYTATFKTINYTINYILNGGTNHADNPNKYNIKNNITLKDPARTGYNFLGWYATEDFSGAAVVSIPQGSTGNKTLYAKWQKDESMWNTVTFATDGKGTLTGTALYSDIFDGTIWSDAITVPIPVAKSGYIFDKWTPALPTSGSKINDNAIYTATFKAIDYTIDYVLNGGTNHADNPSVYNVQTAVELKDPVRTGYNFLGWYEIGDFSGTAIVSIPQGSTGNKTLYAKWEKDSNLWNTIKFITDGNGTLTGISEFADILDGAVWNTVITVPTPVANIGYKFDKWIPSLPFAFSIINDNATYTATFKPINYNITYVLNGGINDVFNPSIYNIKTSFELNAPSRSGYNFLGWYTTEDFSTTAVTSIPLGSTGDKTFYAKWEKNDSQWNSITFVTDGHGTLTGTTTYTDILDGTVWNSLITVPVPSANTGYAFDKWTPALPANHSKINDNAIYTAKFKAINYTINYVLNGGDNHWDNPKVYDINTTVTLKSPVRFAYDFKGWYETSDFSGPAVTNIPTGSTGNKTLYAKWDGNPLFFKDINFVTDGNGTLLGQTSYKDILLLTPWHFAITQIPTPVANEGYNFDKWDPSIPGLFAIVLADETYTAKFKAIDYSINYVLNGGINNSDNPSLYNIQSDITLKDPVRFGYSFLGWYATEDFSGVSVTSIPLGSTGNKTIYAKWEKDANMWNTITFATDGNGTLTGTTIFADILEETVWNSIITVPTPAANIGYAFDGWDPTLPSQDSQINDNATYTAKFKVIEYDINYVLNGGDNDSSNPEVYNINSNITLKEPSRLGYTFKGWYTMSDFSGSAVTYIPTGSTGDKTFYAKWSQDTYTITYNNIILTDINNNPATYKEEDTPLVLNDASRAGYTFLGWYTNSDFSGSKITNIPEGTTGNLVYYANWEKDLSQWNSVTFITDGNGTLTGTTTFTDILDGSVWNSVISVPIPVANTGYAFNSWAPTLPSENSAINDSATYKATFKTIDYNINYVLNGGDNHSDNPTVYDINIAVVIKNPTRFGYNFLGWYSTEEFSGTAVASIPQGSTGDKTFYAKWEKDPSKWSIITFATDGNGTLLGTSNFSDILDGTVFGSVIIVPTPIADTGYAFDRWIPTLPEANSKINDNATYTAKFNAIDYNITYILNGGTNSLSNPAVYNVKSNIALSDPSRAGYTFLGWYKEADFSGTAVTSVPQGSTGNKTFYARWARDDSQWNTITFATNGNGTLTGKTSFTDILDGTIWGTVITVPVPAANEGYTFSRWTPALPAVGFAINNSALYRASFTTVVYNITYELNGGENNANNPFAFTIEHETITLQDATREGYTFDGWYTEPDFSGTVVTEIPSGSIGSIILYAKWTEVAPVTNIEDNEVPLSPAEPILTLLNLFCTILTLIGMAYILASKKDKNDENRAGRRKSTIIAGIVMAAVAVIIFFITQPLVLNFRWVDKWTILFIAITAVQAITIWVKNKKNKTESMQA